jgi:phage shock protein PspC (stress-responsive transcriptional regulator)
MLKLFAISVLFAAVLLCIGLLAYMIFKYLIDVMPDYDDEED